MRSLVFLLVLLAVVVVVVMTATGRIVGGLDDPPAATAPVTLPSGRLTAVDVSSVHFAGVVRGYDMAQVDAVLDRLALEIQLRDDLLAELGWVPSDNGPVPVGTDSGTWVGPDGVTGVTVERSVNNLPSN